MSRARDTIFKRYRVYLVVGGVLCWWGSYQHCYTRESGQGLRVVKMGSFWFVWEADNLRPSTPFESALLSSLPVRYA